MPGTDIPGLDQIVAAAAALGIDVAPTVAKARMLMLPDAPAVRAGRDQLDGVAKGVDPQAIDQSGKGLLTGDWTGQSADAFTARHAAVIDSVTGAGATATKLAAYLEGVATNIENSQQAVLKATGAAAVQLAIMP